MAAPNRPDVREFLTSRRARVRPEQVALVPGANRRVPGLRRTEVALLAGVSVEYYARLERGNLAGASDAVLHAIATALLLDQAEREHLFDLARAATPTRQRRVARAGDPVVRPSLQHTLDAINGGPALVRNGRMDIVATNLLARALYADLFGGRVPPNLARFTFLDRSRSELFHRDWHVVADVTVAILRAEAGRDPHDRDLQDLIGELSTLSEDFRTKWAAHNVRRHTAGVKHFHHPVVGELHFLFEATELMADPGWQLMIYVPEPGSPSADAVRLLASWGATQEQEAGAAVDRMGAPSDH